jgi:hypothetical protein
MDQLLTLRNKKDTTLGIFFLVLMIAELKNALSVCFDCAVHDSLFSFFACKVGGGKMAGNLGSE